ncbi:TPA: endonuclease VII [Escherichia coli]|nr:endonuclease VII [Escherichia coli]
MRRKDIPAYKQELFKKQKGICPISKIQITDVNKAHLDHNHILSGSQAGRCRGLLIAQANVLEGRLKHQFKMSGLASHIDYLSFLKNLIVYLEKDNGHNPVHPQLQVDLLKQFKKQTLKQMRETFLIENIKPEGDKKSLTDLYKKHLKVKYET